MSQELPETLEAEFLARLAHGEPAERLIEELAAGEAARATALRGLADTWERLAELEAGDPPDTARAGVERITEAFEDGFRQGLAEAAHRRRNALSGALRFGVTAAALAVGFFLGNAGDAERTPDPQIDALRADVDGLRQVLALTLLDEPSASQRIQGVSWGARVVSPDTVLIGALFRTLDGDGNINVRLAAAEALGGYADRESVRRGLIGALAHETEPLVQIQLIELLVGVRAPEAGSLFKKLADDEHLGDQVRRHAAWGYDAVS